MAVVDRRREFDSLFRGLSQELQRRRAAGADVDPAERISGYVVEPGYLARAANGHLVRRTIEHGVWPVRLQCMDLPSNLAVLRIDEQR